MLYSVFFAKTPKTGFLRKGFPGHQNKIVKTPKHLGTFTSKFAWNSFGNFNNSIWKSNNSSKPTNEREWNPDKKSFQNIWLLNEWHVKFSRNREVILHLLSRLWAIAQCWDRLASSQFWLPPRWDHRPQHLSQTDKQNERQIPLLPALAWNIQKKIDKFIH